MDMNKVLIADDHAVVRRGLIQTINDEPDFRVAGEARNAQEALDLIAARRFDVVVLDITLPDRNGLLVLQEVKTMHPALPVLILSMHPEEQFALRALKLGASGYLTKETAPDELVSALRVVLGGERYISPKVAEQMIEELNIPDYYPPPETLSDREIQILRKMAMGKSLTQIGKELQLSVKTVSTYRMRIMAKLSARTNEEIIRYAAQNGLLAN